MKFLLLGTELVSLFLQSSLGLEHTHHVLLLTLGLQLCLLSPEGVLQSLALLRVVSKPGPVQFCINNIQLISSC